MLPFSFLLADCFHADCLLHKTAFLVDRFFAGSSRDHRVHGYDVYERSTYRGCTTLSHRVGVASEKVSIFFSKQTNAIHSEIAFQTNTRTRTRPRFTCDYGDVPGSDASRHSTFDVRQIPSRGRAAATDMWALMARIFND